MPKLSVSPQVQAYLIGIAGFALSSAATMVSDPVVSHGMVLVGGWLLGLLKPGPGQVLVSQLPAAWRDDYCGKNEQPFEGFEAKPSKGVTDENR